MLTLIYTGREGGEEGDGEGASGPHQGPLQEPAGSEDQTQDEICGAARGVGFNSYITCGRLMFTNICPGTMN